MLFICGAFPNESAIVCRRLMNKYENLAKYPVFKLLSAFMEHPLEVQKILMKENMRDNSIRVFILIVMLSDGYFKLKQINQRGTPTQEMTPIEINLQKAVKFFKIAHMLNFDLQMYLVSFFYEKFTYLESTFIDENNTKNYIIITGEEIIGIQKFIYYYFFE
jgi:hypothetical protein